MTDAQLLYNLNAKKSRKLCQRMEFLLEESDYLDKEGHTYSLLIALEEVNDIRTQLDKIWDIQVELFDDILEEYRYFKRQAVLDAVRVPKSKTRKLRENY